MKLKKIIKDEPTLLNLYPPITIVGDIHRKFNNLLLIFDQCGYPAKTSYNILIDYVDREPRFKLYNNITIDEKAV